MNTRARTTRAFTIIELLVGLMVAALVLGGASFTLARMISARKASASRQIAFSRADAAASRIALDVGAAARSADLTFAKLAVVDSGNPVTPRDELLMLFTTHRPLRGIDGVPEGQLFESQYRVGAAPDGSSALWRRTDTGFDIAVDGGGVATPEFRGVRTLSVQAYDGTAWFEAWDSDNDGMPHAVRITVTASDNEGLVTATARRVVSIDRVPVPPEAEEEDASTDTSGGGTTTGGGG